MIRLTPEQLRDSTVLARWRYWSVAGISAIIVGVFYWLYDAAEKTTVYGDGITKLNNARRVFDNPTESISLAQLGSVWLIGQTGLASMLAWIDPLYQSGLAGSVWSMLAFIVSCIAVYEVVLQLTHNAHLGALAAVVTLGTNINVIYFATTPMTESMVLASQAVCCLALIKYERSPTSIRWLLIASLVLGGASLVRYETWVYTIISAPAMAFALWRTGFRSWDLTARMGALYATPAFVMLYWMVGWEWVIMGDPLYFSNSRYSAHAIDVIGADKTFAVGDIHEAARQYLAAVRLNSPDLVLLLALGAAVASLAVCLWKRKLPAMGLSYLAGSAFFFPVSLYLGQNAIDIQPGTLLSLNIRYGTTLMPLVAVLVGTGTGGLVTMLSRRRHKWPAVASAWIIILVIGAMQVSHWAQPLDAAVLKDVAAQPSPTMREFAHELEHRYDYGRILAESFGPMNGVQFHAEVDLDQYITEANSQLWEDTLSDPTGKVEWVLVREGDLLDTTLVPSPQFQSQFRQVFANDFGRIYMTVDHEEIQPKGE